MENPEIPNVITFARSSISAGLIIGDLLASSSSIQSMATDVFPVVTDEATLPYISFRAAKMNPQSVKGSSSAETLLIEVTCFSATYEGSVALAECAREALDGRQSSRDGITMRSCLLEDREEDWQDDAYIQKLIFRVKI